MLTADIPHERVELPNGVVAIAVRLPHVHRTVIDAQIRVGSRFEDAADNGLSHFLEHMLYRGTPRHPSAHRQALAFERLGGTLDAATAVDHGSMQLSVPPANFATALELFSEVYQQPVFADLEIEQDIVREEILEGLDDHGRNIDADNLIRELCFDQHPLGRPITGTIEHVDGFDRDRLRRHHEQHYTGAGTVLTVCGPIEPTGVLAAVQRCFEGLPRGQRPGTAPPGAQERPRFRYVRHANSQTALRLGFRAAAEHDALEPATELLLRLLDDGMATRLYHRICDERGLCYDVSAAYEAYADAGLFEIAAESAHDRVPELLDELLAMVRDLRDNGPALDELDKAKARFGWQAEEMLDDPASLAEFFSIGQLTGVGRTPAERLEQLLAVDAAEVHGAARALFRAETLSVVAVGTLPARVQAKLQRAIEAFG